MLKKLLKRFIKDKSYNAQHNHICIEPAPETIELDGGIPIFAFSTALSNKHGFLRPDWEEVCEWIERDVPSALHAQAWIQCEQGWLLHLRDHLGGEYYLIENDTTFILSSLEQRLAGVALAFIKHTRKRILDVLQDIANGEGWGKDILVVCDDAEKYYNYIAGYYPDGHEIVRSSGVFISAGCGHFVTMDADLSLMEPVIVHELTHSYLAHLPLPTWLNEGIAVNVEHHLAGKPPEEFTAQQILVKHHAHWTEKTIQTFWSGEAFHIPKVALLAYDLATNIVTALAKDWAVFTLFVLESHWKDAGTRAAQQTLGIDLAQYVCLILNKDYHIGWAPQPKAGLDANQ